MKTKVKPQTETKRLPLKTIPNENCIKVLFLDIDGVVNSKETLKRQFEKTGKPSLLGIDPELAFRVGKIQMYTDCQVVLSSSWRNHPESMKTVEDRVVKLLDKTPNISKKLDTPIFARGREWDYSLRGDEVNAWLEKHPEVQRYAILDDDSDFYDDQPLFQTSWETGITDEIMYKVILYLNGDEDGNA